MNKKPKKPAPSKSFIRTKEEQQDYMETRQKSEAALVAHLDGILNKIDREEAKAKARAVAQAKALNLSPEETKAFIKKAMEAPLQRDKSKSTHAWMKRGNVQPVRNMGESRSELSRLLGIGKRD
ncbi:MAG: hypothetical protein CFE32_11690 [Alphaproteobacteria bacterium PA3]|nr:MAG: hypothetical protein CFE32_11690 [Alphaproteobacteria bacterium PA3]